MNLYNQTDEAEEIDSALVSRAKIEALNVAERQIDLAWLAEGDKVKGQMDRLERNIDRIIPPAAHRKTGRGGRNTTASTSVHSRQPARPIDAQCAAEEGIPEHLRGCSKAERDSHRLPCPETECNPTETLLNATAGRTLDKGSIVRDAVSKWNESRFAASGSQSGENGDTGEGDETVNRN